MERGSRRKRRRGVGGRGGMREGWREGVGGRGGEG